MQIGQIDMENLNMIIFKISKILTYIKSNSKNTEPLAIILSKRILLTNSKDETQWKNY